MKKHVIPAATGLILLLLMSSCFHHHHRVSMSLSDREDAYEMHAVYRKNQAHMVQVYLDEHLLNNNFVSFKNEPVDEEITLDDQTTFYINAYPGELKIKIDKTENSEESYEKVKQICEDLRDRLADN